jgi:glycosyltransferase involved in cell wall biosynthesis
MREGLPNALCEAMLCECVPVGTDVQGIRTAMGDAGFYASYGDPLATKEAIEKALAIGSGKPARERIRRLFPLEQREKRFAEIIEGLTRE